MRGGGWRPSRFVNSDVLIMNFVEAQQFCGISTYFTYTLQAWPANAKVEAWKMAKAGLRYTGQEEEVHIKINFMKTKPWKTETAKVGHLTGFSSQVTCAWCGCVLGDWQYGDQVEDGSAPDECDQHCPCYVDQIVDFVRFLLSFNAPAESNFSMLYEIKYVRVLGFPSR